MITLYYLGLLIVFLLCFVCGALIMDVWINGGENGE